MSEPSVLVTVLGNLAVDRVDDRPPTPGGAPSFAGIALRGLGPRARIVTRCADADRPLFRELLAAVPVRCDVLTADVTSGFGLRYHGDDREMTVDAIGPVWGEADLAAARVDSTWVHIAPLLRSDFPAATLARLAAQGRLLAFDGQGLVRRPEVGPLVLDADFDPRVLAALRMLKLASEEADAVAGGSFDAAAAARLGVPEILVTFGSGGCDVYLSGKVSHVPVAWPVAGVHATGAGDMFTATYVAARATGSDPLAAAYAASRFVAEQLQARLGSPAPR